MKIKVIFAVMAILSFVLTGCEKSEDVISEPQSTISISGTGNTSAVPDIVDIQLGVDAVSDDPVDAVSENTSKMNAVMDVLDKMEVASSDIQTVYYTMWVEDVYDQEGQMTGEKRFHVTNQINVRLREIDQIGILLESATSAGATNIAGITFGVADTTQMEQTALDNAIANARVKAERIAGEMGLTLGNVINLVEGGFYTPPVPYYGEKGGVGGGGAVPISQGQFSVTAQVQLVFELIP
jgi:uncharacterized protein YggE